MPVDLILPVSITISLIAWSMIVRWYLHPVLARLPLEKAVEPILLLHSFRYIGLMFLVPGVTAQVLDARFSHPAAYGDLAAAILALAAIAAIRLQLRQRFALVWIFNVWGLVDLLSAVTLGMLLTPDGHLGATFWIPAAIVPLLVVTHVYVFVLLLRRPLHRAALAGPGSVRAGPAHSRP